jgi:hypothetical protein
MAAFFLPFTPRAYLEELHQVSRILLSGASDDPGIRLKGQANIVPTDQDDAIAFGRTTSQVLNIVYGGVSPTAGLFFPNGVNGTIHSVT